MIGLTKQYPFEYNSWRYMIGRCYNPKSNSFVNYGKRGITVCKQWIGYPNGFKQFLIDMGERPQPKRSYSIDRIDNNGNYEPNNCKWSLWIDQQRNKRKSIPKYVFGKLNKNYHTIP